MEKVFKTILAVLLFAVVVFSVTILKDAGKLSMMTIKTSKG